MSSSELTALWQAELKLSLQHAALTAKLSATTSGDLVLDSFLASGNFESNAAELAETRDQLQAIERAIKASRARRVDAIKAYYTSEAAQLHHDASKLRLQAEMRRATTAELLAKLKEHEGIDYMPVAYHPVLNQYQLAPTPATHSERLEAQAEQLDRRAQTKESEPIRDFGQIQASSANDAIRQIENLSPLEIAPMLPDVARWLAEQAPKVVAYETKARKATDGWRIIGGNTVIALVWRAGELDAASRYDWVPIYRIDDSDRVHTAMLEQSIAQRKATQSTPIEA